MADDLAPSHARATFRSFAFLGWFLLLLPVHVAALASGSHWSRRIPVMFHRGLLYLFGIRVRRVGRPSQKRPTLFASNHASWLDIVVLSSLVPVSFVAKAEIAGWFFFGWLAKLQRSIFIDRRRSQAVAHGTELASRLADSDNIVLFPEGTSGDGNRVHRFRSALFNFAERDALRGLTVQPVSICYSGLNGLPMDRRNRPLIAWYGGMDLLPHVWQLLGLGHAEVTVSFHPPLPEISDRKQLARLAERSVADGLALALAGRGRGGAAGGRPSTR
ncbi:MAG: 1-acyl-sn-glycerol-3-phosphate acyltransferase [Alphaproteobacteria bacterium]|nr:1-acyl-sn-glycerol-3-phosphate acyltransferase [Alphaproteobacteria bacterium]